MLPFVGHPLSGSRGGFVEPPRADPDRSRRAARAASHCWPRLLLSAVVADWKTFDLVEHAYECGSVRNDRFLVVGDGMNS